MVEDEIVEEAEVQAIPAESISEPEVQQQDEAEPDKEATDTVNGDKIEVNTDFLNEDLIPKDERPIAESKEIDKLGAARRLACPGKLAAVDDHVNRTGFTGVRAARHGHLGARIGHELFGRIGTQDEFGVWIM